MKARHLAAALAAFALGIAALAIARTHAGGSLGGQSAAANVALLGAGWALAAAGTLAWVTRPASRCGPLLVLAGLAWFAVELDNPEIGSSLVFTLGLATYAVCPAIVAHAALAYPGGRLGSWPERAAVSAAYVCTLGVQGLAAAAVYDPAPQGCSECPRNLLTVANEADLLDTFDRAGLWLGIAWAAALVGLAAWRVARASAAARLLTAPVLVPLVAYIGLVAADYAHSLSRGYLSNDAVDELLWIAQGVALVALSAGVALAWARGLRARTAVTRLVIELSEAPVAGGLRAVLAGALGDPGLAVAYPLSDGGWVDATGRPVDPRPRPGRAATPLLRGGEPVALVLHRAELLDDPGLVEEVTRAARLALEHERLEAELRAQLEQLRASRARTVEAGDAERRRLERDLHDGAQQRLVVLSLALRLLREQLGPGAQERIDAADAELRAALGDLRALGRGIYPAVLEAEGLAAAVGALAEEASVPIATGAMPRERLAAAVEAAAYFLVAEVVKRASASAVRVAASRERERLLVEITARGSLDDELVDLGDRIGALDGRLSIDRGEPELVAIRAEVPCAS
jgi:signal transduction histidine kinase